MIKVNNLKKKLSGKEILKDLNCEFEGIFGLVGPNGAGKTTLLKLLANVNKSYEGSINRGGTQKIGYLPQNFITYENLTVRETLTHFSILKGNKSKKNENFEVESILKKVNLWNSRDVKAKHLSGGMLRRLGIAQALIGNPNLLIIDEPFNGLDYEERIRLKVLLQKICNEPERTVVITSHLVDDLEEICTNIGILIDGKILNYGKLKKIMEDFKGKIWETNNEKVIFDSEKRSVILLEKRIFANNSTSTFRFYSSDHFESERKVLPELKDIYLYYVRKENNSYFEYN